MIPDFSAILVKTGEPIFFEAKGHQLAPWPTKLQLWRVYGPGPLEIWKGTYKYPELVDVVYPAIPKMIKPTQVDLIWYERMTEYLKEQQR